MKAGLRWAVGWKRKETRQSRSCALPEELVSHNRGCAQRAFNLKTTIRHGKVSVRYFSSSWYNVQLFLTAPRCVLELALQFRGAGAILSGCDLKQPVCTNCVSLGKHGSRSSNPPTFR